MTAAKAASTAVVVVSDDTESEATDRLSLNLPSAQDELISAVAAANPHTVVVINAGAPVVMPWLNQVAGVLDAWYPGQSSGTALASVLFGQTDPSGHLPVTFPQNLSQVPASTTAQFPGNGTTVQYSEGLDIGYRWYNAKDIQPLFPFGYGLSYTTFAYSNLRVTPVVNGTQDVRVSATVTNVGNRSGADVAQLYVTDPPAAGEPPRQLKGFQRVSLAPGQSTRVQFTVTPSDISWFDTSAPDSSATGGGWSQSAGLYQVYVGDSAGLSNLPLRGGFLVTSTPGARQVAVSAPTRDDGGPGRRGQGDADLRRDPDAVRRADLAAAAAGLDGGAADRVVRRGDPGRVSDGDLHGVAAVLRAEYQPGRARHGQSGRIGHPRGGGDRHRRRGRLTPSQVDGQPDSRPGDKGAGARQLAGTGPFA